MNPSRNNLSTSPPAAATAFIAAWPIRTRRSLASFSRLALVLELPLGATPVMRAEPSLRVKLTKPKASTSASVKAPVLAPRGRLRFRMAHGRGVVVVVVPGVQAVSFPELCRDLWALGELVDEGDVDEDRALGLGLGLGDDDDDDGFGFGF